MDQIQAIEGGELLLLNVDASSPRIHRGREPPETARKQSGDGGDGNGRFWSTGLFTLWWT
jgi:predicted metal-dependent peptidase